MQQKKTRKKEIVYKNKAEFDRVIKLIQSINDDRTVVVAPSLASAKSPSTKLRVYSWGGKILELSTTNAGNRILPNPEYDAYTDKTLVHGLVSYPDITVSMLKDAIEAAKNRATGANPAIGNGREYAERSMETRMIQLNRQDKNAKAILIDMEFRTPNGWIEKKARYGGKSTAGKPDFVIYDPVDKSFGIVELKYNNDSCGNMEKHFADFYNMVHSKRVEDIKREFARKMRYLTEYGLIRNIQEEDILEACKKDLWMAFIFVGGDAGYSRMIFDSAKIDTRHVVRSGYGFLHVDESETSSIDYSRKHFFAYLGGAG